MKKHMKKPGAKAKHLKAPSRGAFPHHQNLAKGGVVKMADGGLAGTPVPGGAQQPRVAAQPIIAAPPQNTLAPTTAPVNTTAATGAGQTGLFGTISGLTGTQNNFQGQAATLTPGTSTAQLNQAYQGAQGGLQNQNQLANQLLPGVGTGVNNQNMLANEYAAMTQGQGPNPAQAELAQATGQNVANQAALMAGQRGSAANAGLIAREAAQQGASTQQQAAGQAATLEAQQQIAAQQNLANLSAQQVGQAGTAVGAQNTAQQNEQNILQNANTSLNNAAVGMQSNINNVNSQTAAANQQNQQGILSGVGNMLSNAPVVGSLFSYKGGEIPKMADGGQIAANPLLGNQTNGPPATDWQAPQFTQSSASNGPVIPGTSSLPTGTGYTTSDSSDSSAPAEKPAMENTGQGPTQAAASQIGAGIPYAGATIGFARGGNIATGPHRSHVANFLASGGRSGVKAVVSPKEVYLAPEQVHKVLHEGADPMKIGHKFPGKDKVKGRDSLKNDVIPTTLESGGCVIPVHITTHKEASERGRKFVRRVMARHMKRPGKAGA